MSKAGGRAACPDASENPDMACGGAVGEWVSG
ncbi:hypothetical protein ABID00_000313 [Faecalicatena orotica]